MGNIILSDHARDGMVQWIPLAPEKTHKWFLTKFLPAAKPARRKAGLKSEYLRHGTKARLLMAFGFVAVLVPAERDQNGEVVVSFHGDTRGWYTDLGE